MDDAAGEDPVERRLSCERAVQQRAERRGLSGWDERCRPAPRAEHGGVDTRRRSEAHTWHAPDESQLVPRAPGAAEQRRRPDGGSLRGEPPFHDCVELRQRDSWIPEQAAEDRGARGEGEVRDDGERLVRERHPGRVRLEHLDARVGVEARPQLSQRRRVELDRAHAGAGVGERTREGTAAGAEIERERARRDSCVPNELVREGAATKGVTAARPRLR